MQTIKIYKKYTNYKFITILYIIYIKCSSAYEIYKKISKL